MPFICAYFPSPVRLLVIYYVLLRIFFNIRTDICHKVTTWHTWWLHTSHRAPPQRIAEIAVIIFLRSVVLLGTKAAQQCLYVFIKNSSTFQMWPLCARLLPRSCLSLSQQEILSPTHWEEKHCFSILNPWQWILKKRQTREAHALTLLVSVKATR